MNTAIKQSMYRAMMAAIMASNFENQKSFEKFIDGLKSEDKEQRAKSLAHLNKATRTVHDLTYGNQNDINRRFQKVTNGEISPVSMGQLVVVFENLFDEGTLDLEWRRAFAFDDLTGAEFGLIGDMLNMVVWDDYEMNQPIMTSPLKHSDWDKIDPERKGGGVAINQRQIDLGNITMATMDNIIRCLRFKSEEHKADFAYTILQAAITAANAAAYTTAFVTGNLPQTLNNAWVDLMERNQDRGYAISGQTRALLIANETHRSVIETAFSATVGDDGENTTILYPIERAYTFNLAADLGISGSRAAMILPGRKNRFGDFQTLKIESERIIKTDGVEIIGQEQYNAQTDTDQFQVIAIA